MENPAKRKKFYDQEIANIKLQKSLNEKEEVDLLKNLKLAETNYSGLSEKLRSKEFELAQVKTSIVSAQE